MQLHFEESQFEAKRADGKQKLKQTAIPTLFDVPNPPLPLTDKRVKGFGCPKPNTLLDKMKSSKVNFTNQYQDFYYSTKYFSVTFSNISINLSFKIEKFHYVEKTCIKISNNLFICCCNFRIK